MFCVLCFCLLEREEKCAVVRHDSNMLCRVEVFRGLESEVIVDHEPLVDIHRLYRCNSCIAHGHRQALFWFWDAVSHSFPREGRPSAAQREIVCVCVRAPSF